MLVVVPCVLEMGSSRDRLLVYSGVVEFDVRGLMEPVGPQRLSLRLIGVEGLVPEVVVESYRLAYWPCVWPTIAVP